MLGGKAQREFANSIHNDKEMVRGIKLLLHSNGTYFVLKESMIGKSYTENAYLQKKKYLYPTNLNNISIPFKWNKLSWAGNFHRR